MKTKYFFLAAAAALFAACSSDDGIAEQQQQVQQQSGEVPVAFDSYVGRATTRAGQTGVMTTKTGDKNLYTSGFGVFAYYTNADNYDQSFTPNFMYNQQVTSDKPTTPASHSKWLYTPIKYWPNEFGSKALSDDVDKVSFFAYAPYVTVNPTSGKVLDNHENTGVGKSYAEDNGDITMGIVGMKRNNATGDPMVKYISTFYTDQQVDLVWGTVKTPGWGLKNGGGTQVLNVGLPYLNVQHPYKTSSTWGEAQKVDFDFKHGLAALNVQVDTKVDKPTVAAPAAGTKVFIRSVTFEGFDTKGALNLNNITKDEALWYNFNCEDELNNGAEVTIKDGRKDGKEGVTEATKEYAAINPIFVQNAVWDETTAGVTEAPKNLFRLKTAAGDPASYSPADDAPIYVIPNDDALKVTIEYDVLTKDANLAGIVNDGETKGSVVKNVITRYITGGGTGDVANGAFKLKNGKKYTINLHLGLNSVQFEASITEWPTTAETGGADLPHNN